MSSTALLSAAPSSRLSRGRSASRTVACTALALGLLLSACGSSDELGGTVVKDGLGCTLTEADAPSADPPTIEAGTEVGDEVDTKDLVEADEKACEADVESYLTVQLVGADAKEGKTFTSTFEDGQPLTIRLGQNQLIAGLETGLLAMPVGARRQIVVPAALAYGADGNEAQGIGKDEDLVFVVDLLSLTDAPLYCNPVTTIPEGTTEGKPTEVKMPAEPPTGEVTTTVLKEGDGPEVGENSYVTVNYLGASCATGQQFDSSWDREEPITAALGEAEPTATANPVIPGWTDGLVGQKVGSLVQLDIPAELAYGAAGSPPAILPNDPITFVIEIIEASDEAPADPAAESTTTVAPVTEDTTTTTAAG